MIQKRECGMKSYYRVFWASVVSGTCFGILYGIYSLLAQNKYLANRLHNLASLQFLQSFDTIAILLIVFGILTSIVLKYEKQIQSIIRGSQKIFLIAGGGIMLIGFVLLRVMRIDIPLLQIQKDALLFKLSYGLLFILFSSLVFLLLLRFARGMTWPQQRVTFLLSSFVLVGINLAVLSTALINKMSAANRPNLVIISIDTIRAYHLGCYGYYRNTSPAIDRFAEESIRFHRAVVPMSTTLPSHSSLLTGDNPVTHGVKMNGMKFNSKNLTLTEVLKNEGYSTAAMVGAVILKKEMGLTLGFDAYDDEMPGRLTRTAEEVRQSAEDWLEQKKKSGFFMLLHFYDTHDPYTPSAPFDTMWLTFIDRARPITYI
jgi:hypothetical protein